MRDQNPETRVKNPETKGEGEKFVNGQTMNIIELLGWGLLFFVGYSLGYLISQTHGFLPGFAVGFISWLLTLFLVNKLRLKIGQMTR